MPDIPQPSGLTAVQTREDGRGQGMPNPQSRRMAETYQETERVRPPDDDRVTIIGIPIEQITPSTQAALAGLVAENATLRAQVRRLERGSVITKKSGTLLERDGFIARLQELLASPPGADGVWILTLIHVQTYEDIRRSSGLLAANTALDDVGHRLLQLDFDMPAVANENAPPADSPPTRAKTALVASGYLGGLTLGALFAAPAAADATDMARNLHDALTRDGYDVAGLSMTLAIRTAAAVVGAGESALLAIARVDHLSRGTR